MQKIKSKKLMESLITKGTIIGKSTCMNQQRGNLNYIAQLKQYLFVDIAMLAKD